MPVSVSLQRQFKNSPFECFTCTINIYGIPYWITECVAWKYSIFLYHDKNEMGKKRWIKSYPIWIVQNKSVNAIQLVSRHFVFVLSSFRLPDFMWLSPSLSLWFTHKYSEFSVLLSRNLNFIVSSFVYRQIHFKFFFLYRKSRIIGLLLRSPQKCQHKKKTFNSNKMWFEHNETFFVFVFYHSHFMPDS